MIIGLILSGMILGMIAAAVALVAGYSLIMAFMVYIGVGVLVCLSIALRVALQAVAHGTSLEARHGGISALSDR